MKLGALAAATVVEDAATFTGKRCDYTVAKTGSGYTVTGSGATSMLFNVAKIRFSDITLNLVVGDKSKMIAAAGLKTLIELYVAFFNRVPDADSLAYWIDQFKSGQTVDQISDSFYTAAVQYSSPP
ncbi:hypothetical protein EGT07_02370 [Herbaspirillum sp. HC18]|nr:hypothetical protein EGT07_02370 [Herbaspirillum sp. HC18]